jgi:hypothetical protein
MQDNSSTLAPVLAEYLTREQAAQLINMSPAWLRKQERLKAGPVRVRTGKCVRYTRTALHAFMSARVEV